MSAGRNVAGQMYKGSDRALFIDAGEDRRRYVFPRYSLREIGIVFLRYTYSVNLTNPAKWA